MPSIAYNGRRYGINGANGKNVVVAKVEPIIGGNRVTFSYYDDNNVQQSSSLKVMNGEKGTSIASAKVVNGNELILTLSNGEEINAGKITVDVDNLELENFYDKDTIDTLLLNQKNDLESYVDEKVESKFSETIDTVEQNDISNLFS